MDRILTNLNWNDLRVFLAVEQAGSIRGAARQIGKTHATVSRHIQSFQQSLGKSAIERRREGQCLTEFGDRILPLAKQIEKIVAEIDRLAYAEDTGLAGTVKLSLSESLYIALLHQPIDEFMQRYPMIDVEIKATDDLVKLTFREADVIIRITANPPNEAYGRKLANSPLAIYTSAEYQKNRPKIDRWIALEYEPARLPVIPARVVAHVDTLALAAKMIGMGRGIGLLPCYIGDSDTKLIRLDEATPIPDMEIWVLTHNDLRSNPRVRVFMDHLYEAFDIYREIIEGRKPHL